MIKKRVDPEKVEAAVAKALAEVPIDDKSKRDAILVQLREKYTELEPLKFGINKEDRQRLEEIGRLIALLERLEPSVRKVS